MGMSLGCQRWCRRRRGELTLLGDVTMGVCVLVAGLVVWAVNVLVRVRWAAAGGGAG